jgi:hypothetical protein
MEVLLQLNCFEINKMVDAYCWASLSGKKLLIASLPKKLFLFWIIIKHRVLGNLKKEENFNFSEHCNGVTSRN